MGYGCTLDAGQTERLIQEACAAQNGSANQFALNGKTYFYQIGRENADGAITGTVLEVRPAKDGGEGLCYRVESFRIDPDGRLVRGAKIKALLKTPYKMPQAKFENLMNNYKLSGGQLIVTTGTLFGDQTKDYYIRGGAGEQPTQIATYNITQGTVKVTA